VSPVVVAVGDLATSARLYGTLLALPPEPVARGRVTFATSRGRIVLRTVGETPPVPDLGLAAVVLAVSDKTAVADLTEAAGGVVMHVVRRGDDAWTSS
jgi:hypothetical protein